MNQVRRIAFFLLLIAAAALPAPARAQTGDTLRILRIDTSQFPTIRVHIRAFCNGRQFDGLSTFTVDVKDGTIQKQFTIQCPNETVPMSIAFALDRSSSVAGTTWYRIQEGAWRFFELFQQHQTGLDEGAIVSFGFDVILEQPMTTNIFNLQDALLNIFPMGNTALLDGVLAALMEIANNARNPIRAVVVFSDGGENASYASLSEVISFARANGIPIYSVALTYNSTPEDIRTMQKLADSTGGMYLEIRHPDDIIPMFEAIASLVTGGANDCIIEYKTDCPDGSEREVEVTARVCGTTLTQRARYRVPLDPTLPAVDIRFDSTFAYVDGDVFIPVMISAIGSQATISDLHFKVYEGPPLQFVSVITTPHFARNFSVDAHVTSDTLDVRLTGSAILTGSDTLLVLRYRAGSVPRDSVFLLPLFYFNKQTQQCMQLRVHNTQVRLLPRPVLTLGCTDTVRVSWDRARSGYDPETIRVQMNISNAGSAPAMNTKAWITRPYGVELAAGSDTVVIVPSQMDIGSSAQIAYLLRIVPVDTARTFTICISVKSDSGTVTTCCATIITEAGRPSLTASCSLPAEIRWVDSLRSFVPPSFPVILTVVNTGPVPARAPEAWIHVPAGFEVSPSTPINTVIAPSILRQNDTGSVMWMVTPLDRMTADTVEFCIKVAAGRDTAVCCRKVFITNSPVRATLACQNGRILDYDEEKNEYNPPQFLVATTVVNTSGNPMAQAQGRISLPSFLRLGPGETQTKNLPGGAVVQPGDSATISWVVVPSGIPPGSSQICIEILASNYPGGRCCIPLTIRTSGLPALACELTGPDTVRYTDNGYQPDPLTLDITVRNDGTTAAKNVFVALLQGADLSIDPSDQALKRISDSLAAGAQASSQFRIRVLDRSIARMDTIRVSVYGSNGGAVVCEKYVFIEAVRAPRMELSCEGPDSLVFSDSLNAYVPSPFAITLRARNTGTATADSVVAEFLSAPNFELVTGEQAVKLLAPSTLAIGEEGTAQWGVSALTRATGRFDTIRTQVRVRGRLLQPVEPCPTVIYVPPFRAAELRAECSLDAPVSVIDNAYAPDPFHVRLTVRNTGDARAFQVRATASFPARLTLAAGETATRTIDILTAPGAADLVWAFHPSPSLFADTVAVCFRISALYQQDIECCVNVILPALAGGAYTIACAAPDTVRFDTLLNAYPSPIPVTATVTNPTAATVDSIRAGIVLPNGLVLATGESPDRLVRDLLPGGSEQLAWRVDVAGDTSTVTRRLQVRMQFFSGGELRQCERTIYVLPPPRPGDSLAWYTTACSTPDTIRYVNAQIGLQPSPFTAEITFRAFGAPVAGLNATIQLPDGITLASGESATKALGIVLSPGGSASVSWSCIAGQAETPRTLTIRFLVHAQNADSDSCDAAVVVEGVYRTVRLTIPRGNVLREGQAMLIPVAFSNPENAVLRSFSFDLRHDSATIAVDHVSQDNSLTAGWPSIGNASAPGRLRLSAGPGDPLPQSGTLLYFSVRALSGDGSANRFAFKLSDLVIDSTAFPPGVRVIVDNGDIVTSGDCLLPLKASERFLLKQNQPNPFSHRTSVQYSIAQGSEPQPVRLEVYDTFGRLVLALDQGVREPGDHRAVLDGSALAPGVYWYRLSAPGFALMRSMVRIK